MHFPLFVDLTGKPCLVIGAGSVAARKVRMLADFGARVTVVASRGGVPASPEWDSADVLFHRRPFRDADLAGMTLAVAATDDAALNARIASLCRERGVPVNVVDDPANCTFIFPAIAKKGPVVAAVSTGGVCPVATQVVRDRVAELLTDRFCETVERLGAQREALKREIPNPAARRDRMRKELESC